MWQMRQLPPVEDGLSSALLYSTLLLLPLTHRESTQGLGNTAQWCWASTFGSFFSPSSDDVDLDVRIKAFSSGSLPLVAHLLLETSSRRSLYVAGLWWRAQTLRNQGRKRKKGSSSTLLTVRVTVKVTKGTCEGREGHFGTILGQQWSMEVSHRARTYPRERALRAEQALVK